MTKDIQTKPVKRKRSASLDKRKARGGWLFVLPFVIGFILIYLPIVIDSIRYSFHIIKPIPGGGFELIPVGWQNYNDALFVNPDYVTTLLSGLGDMFFDIPMILIFSLFMAVLLNQKMAGRAAFRAIFFIPVIISTGILSEIEGMNINSDSMGETGGIDDGTGQESTSSQIVSSIDVQVMFEGMAVGQGLVEYVAQAINNIYDIVNRSGVQMLIFLAGLQSISPAIYESVQIDGATAWETFWKITFPMISPMILVNAVYTVIDSFTAESNVVMKFISNAYNDVNGNVISSAMAWMYFLIVIAILAIVALLCSSFVFYQRRDK